MVEGFSAERFDTNFMNSKNLEREKIRKNIVWFILFVLFSVGNEGFDRNCGCGSKSLVNFVLK